MICDQFVTPEWRVESNQYWSMINCVYSKYCWSLTLGSELRNKSDSLLWRGPLLDHFILTKPRNARSDSSAFYNQSQIFFGFLVGQIAIFIIFLNSDVMLVTLGKGVKSTHARDTAWTAVSVPWMRTVSQCVNAREVMEVIDAMFPYF